MAKNKKALVTDPEEENVVSIVSPEEREREMDVDEESEQPEDLTEVIASTPGRPKTAAELERENERLKALAFQLERDLKIQRKRNDSLAQEKRKPGITTLDREGKPLRWKRPNSTHLSDEILPPYTKNQVAIYRIIESDGINPATGLKVDPVPSLIPGRYTLIDKFEKDPMKRNKVMRNIVSTETKNVGGEIKTVEVEEDIVFHRGFIQVPVKDNYPLYVFMELHPLNKSNKHRPFNVRPVFERVDVNYQSQSAKNINTELALDAGNEVRNMTKDEVLSYAVTANPPIVTVVDNRPRRIDEIRSDLMRYVMNDPIGFFKQHRNLKAAVSINVADALDFGLVEYRPGDKTFIFTETDEEIFTHTAHEEPVKALINHLAKEENREMYEAVKNRLNHWNVE